MFGWRAPQQQALTHLLTLIMNRIKLYEPLPHQRLVIIPDACNVEVGAAVFVQIPPPGTLEYDEEQSISDRAEVVYNPIDDLRSVPEFTPFVPRNAATDIHSEDTEDHLGRTQEDMVQQNTPTQRGTLEHLSRTQSGTLENRYTTQSVTLENDVGSQTKQSGALAEDSGLQLTADFTQGDDG
ncbi:hypothetical protein SARC_00904 [Sphaeroforma arctica JP610]|uniref:Uncharacterized protein n=1 Tax=Sphaeroforma arctica JP610 TaxID=667725 RepID=A0A0L0GF78_9EUKA|nr:hypothetical protein SARC_00904 [Sphaeroforma arctica JP610]KNC86953.1 hypothetical protein SARC_00904 [Sphaeroforma arctica JP610]|eukprot:XP_014160855.1 hypothetical protein SARC_00904 [Sphaeroforma arctica JP610]